MDRLIKSLLAALLAGFLTGLTLLASTRAARPKPEAASVGAQRLEAASRPHGGEKAISSADEVVAIL